MTRIIVKETKEERSQISGDVNKLQARDSCLLCKKTGHQKKDCQSYEVWKKKNPNNKTGNTGNMIS